MTLQLAAGDARLVVDPAAGARAVSLQVAGTELLGHADGAGAVTPTGHGMFLMAPWPGRLRDNTLRYAGTEHPMPADPRTGWAMHGTVLDQVWTVDSAGADHAELSIALAPPWPWAGRVRAGWRLSADRLDAMLSVESDRDVFPAAVGWHPWFRRTLDSGGPVQVHVPGDQMLERGADHLPTGRLLSSRPPGPYDDTFPLPGGSAEVLWPGALRLQCRTDCRYVVLFDEQLMAVCLEPQTAAPDQVSTDPTLVTPESPLVARASWSWT